MTYKSLLCVVTDGKAAEPALAQMTTLADRLDSHAEILCMGLDRTQLGYYDAGATAMVLQESIDRAQSDAAELLAHVNKTMGKSDIRWSAEESVVPVTNLGRQVAFHSRFTDLVIAPQPYGEHGDRDAETVIEAALFGGQAPVLVVPSKGQPISLPQTVVVAWNESAESLNAIRRSIPFLQAANRVRITIIDPPAHGPERSDPGGMLGQMLARHGISCEIDVLSQTMPKVSDILNRHVADTGADMLVMGAYGHSRLREAVLGGATRHMLEKATVPVLMAH